MVRNYLKIAVRSLTRKMGYTAINIIGLSIGMAACIMMVAYVQDELTYDEFHSKGSDIYRITYEYERDGESAKVALVPFPLKQVLTDEFPEVNNVTRLYSNSSLNNFPVIRYEKNEFTEEGFYFSDPNIFEVFDFKLSQGNPETALKDTESVVITQEIASRYFGDQDPMGKTLRYENRKDLTVTGVLEEFPENSHIKFDFLAPINLQRFSWIGGAGNNGYDLEKDWNWSGSWTYVHLNKNVDIGQFSEKLKSVHSRFTNDSEKIEYEPQPFLDIHFGQGFRGEMSASGNLNQLYTFTVIALLILLIACINFMNLTTAQSTRRAREVGIRKVMGAHRNNLIIQFLGEALIVALIASVLAGLISEVSIPYFNYLTGKQLDIDYFNNLTVISLLLGGAVAVGIFSGSYPAFVLSAFQPVKTLKGALSASKGASLRKILVVGQFFVSILLITGILVIKRQLDFVRSTDLGFDKEHLLVVKNGGSIHSQLNVFRDKLLSESEIQKVYYGQIPAVSIWRNTFDIEGKNDPTSLGLSHVGLNFIEMFDLELLSGKNFPQEQHADSLDVVLVNESLINTLGWSVEEAIGKRLSYIGGSDNKTRYDLNIIGVIQDANFQSLHHKIAPIVFQPANWGDLAIKLNPGNVTTAVTKIKDTWKAMNPEWPFEYSFLDQDIDNQYKKEIKLSETIQYFTFLAIFIACTGMLGLVSFTTAQRAKEVSIRKVLGASISTLVKLLTQGYFKLVVIALLIAVIPGYLLAQHWLSDFAYRIDLTFDVFVIAGSITLFIALITVSYHSIKISLLNPVDNLRDE